MSFIIIIIYSVVNIDSMFCNLMDLLYREAEVHISSVFFQGPGSDGDGRNLRVVSTVK